MSGIRLPVNVARKQHDYINDKKTKVVCCARRLEKQKPIKPQNLPWVRVSLKMVTVAGKLSSIEKLYGFFQRGYYRHKGHNTENLSEVRVPMKMLSVARETNYDKSQHQDESVRLARGTHELHESVLQRLPS
jgi:hypothetical protein